MSGEQGYAQGRLIVDIGSFLFGLGELKGITNSWKRLKKIDFTGVLSKLKKPEQKVIKTETTKYIDDAFSVVEEHAPKSLPEVSEVALNYEKYVQRKKRLGQTPRDFNDWKNVSDYFKKDSPIARGNRFDKKAKTEGWYRYHQVHLSNGKRLDSYNEAQGMIVSRKSIDLSKIGKSRFEAHLKEFREKYDVGTIIRSNKYEGIDKLPLQGKFYLEIPDYNKNLPELEEFIKLARKYDVEIIFKPE